METNKSSTQNVNIYPRYQHDCERCYFLGHAGQNDLWFCPLHGGECIQRFGDEGFEYGSISLEYAPMSRHKAYFQIRMLILEMGITCE